MGHNEEVSIKAKYYRSGILLQKFDNKTLLSSQFIKIKAPDVYTPICVSTKNNAEINEIEGKIQQSVDLFNENQLTLEQHLTVLSKIAYDKPPVKTPFANIKDQQTWIDKWNEDREVYELVQSMIAVLKDGNQVVLVSGKNSSCLVLYIDLGPEFDATIDKRDVVELHSMLNIHYNVPFLRRVVSINTDGELYFKSPWYHPQRRHISKKVMQHLLGEYINRNTSSPQLSGLYPLVNSQSGSNYIFSMKGEITHSKYLNLSRFAAYQDFTLLGGKVINLVANEKQLQDFIVQYGYTNIIQNIDVETFPDNVHELYNQRLIMFGPHKPAGLVSIDPTSLRLDMVRALGNESTMSDFFAVFKVIDVIYGYKYFSTKSDFERIIKDLRNFDDELITSISTYNDLLNLLHKPLTNQTYLGNTRSVLLIYRLLRQFSLNQVLDPFLNKNSLEADTNFFGTPPFCHIPTTNLSPHDAVVLLFLLLYRITNFKEEPVHQPVTLLVSDRRMINLLGKDEPKKILENILDMDTNLRIIFHSPDLRMAKNYPTLLMQSYLSKTPVVYRPFWFRLSKIQQYKVFFKRPTPQQLQLVKLLELKIHQHCTTYNPQLLTQPAPPQLEESTIQDTTLLNTIVSFIIIATLSYPASMFARWGLERFLKRVTLKKNKLQAVEINKYAPEIVSLLDSEKTVKAIVFNQDGIFAMVEE